MAELRNDSGALRFTLEAVAREGAPPGAGPSAGRLLATAGLEYLDQRDREWWPLLRLPALRLAAASYDALRDALGEYLRGGSAGFTWRPEGGGAFAVQLGPDAGGAVLEIGIDLGAFLSEVAGVPLRPASELALFRFRSAQADLVRFSDALGREREALDR